MKSYSEETYRRDDASVLRTCKLADDLARISSSLLRWSANCGAADCAFGWHGRWSMCFRWMRREWLEDVAVSDVDGVVGDRCVEQVGCDSKGQAGSLLGGPGVALPFPDVTVVTVLTAAA